MLTLQCIRSVMDLNQFQRINVLSLPIYEASQPPDSWPPRFFLHNHHHVIFAEYSAERKVVTLYDSLGRSGFLFYEPFYANHIAIRHFFGTRVLQRSPRSRVCAYHAVIFSFGYFSPEPEYRISRYFPSLLRRAQRIISERGKNFDAIASGLSTSKGLKILPLGHLRGNR